MGQTPLTAIGGTRPATCLSLLAKSPQDAARGQEVTVVGEYDPMLIFCLQVHRLGSGGRFGEHIGHGPQQHIRIDRLGEDSLSPEPFRDWQVERLA